MMMYTKCGVVMLFFFFFKQKTAYEMRISDWSSDVCSSDLLRRAGDPAPGLRGDPVPGDRAEQNKACGRDRCLISAWSMPGSRARERCARSRSDCRPCPEYDREVRKSTRLNSSH